VTNIPIDEVFRVQVKGNKMKIAVLIPCYNESKTIGSTIKGFQKVLPEADIYVYDNNSSDHTDTIAQDAGAIVRYEYRQGKGNVLRSMFREINSDCYILVDGDNTYPAENAREMADLVLYHNVDMVVGDRLSSTYFTENKRRFHNFGNVLVRRLVNTFFKGNIKDIMTGYRAFSPKFVKSFPVLSEGFEIETEMTIHALDKNLHVKSVPVDYRDRPKGSVSKLNTYNDGFKVLKTIFTLYKDYRPLSFFSTFALIMVAISAILFVPVFLEYLDTGLVLRFPTLIVSTIIFVVAVLSLVCGFILDTVAKKHRQLFEVQLNMIEMQRHMIGILNIDNEGRHGRD
jgi:glycosyltransferase involved in cell wall biosynthesis